MLVQQNNTELVRRILRDYLCPGFGSLRVTLPLPRAPEPRQPRGLHGKVSADTLTQLKDRRVMSMGARTHSSRASDAR